MIEHILDHVLPATYACLPPRMASPEATALLLAIGLQESRFEHRRQMNGPARGFFQFELNGIQAVLSHADSAEPIDSLARQLCYGNADSGSLYRAVEHNDVLAAGFARCLLWTLPNRLPRATEYRESWQQYLACWRPGAPREASWAVNFATGWALVTHSQELQA